MWRSALVLTLSLLTGACASVGKQTQDLVKHPPDIAPKSRLRVEFIKQSDKNCGPATLTMALRAAGFQANLDEITHQVFVKEKEGTLPMDMVAAARREGAMAVPVRSLVGILNEVAAGHPVVAMENLGLSWYPKWHYSLVIGYDLPTQNLIMHSGTEAATTKTFNYFEHSWTLADSWSLVLLRPGELAASASELDHLQAAVGLELADRPADAKLAYEAILKRWPRSLGAHIGLANMAYQNKDLTMTMHLLRTATELHPDSLAAKHNLSVAEKEWRKRKSVK